MAYRLHRDARATGDPRGLSLVRIRHFGHVLFVVALPASEIPHFFTAHLGFLHCWRGVKEISQVWLGHPRVSCRAALDRFIRVASSRTAGTFGRS